MGNKFPVSIFTQNFWFSGMDYWC